MKYIKILLLIISAFTIFTASSFAAKSACIGELVTLNYNVSGATSCDAIVSTDPAKYPDTSVSLSGGIASGNQPYTASVPATFNLTCYSPATVSSDNLTIKTADDCCATNNLCPQYCPAPRIWGKDGSAAGVCCAIGETWSGTVCLAPPTAPVISVFCVTFEAARFDQFAAWRHATKQAQRLQLGAPKIRLGFGGGQA